MFAGTRWNDFVKDYASKNNVAYGCAITKAEVKEAYKLAYPKNKVGRPPKKDKIVKEKKPRGRPKKPKDNIQMKIVEKRPVKKGSTFLTEIPEIETSAENVVYEPLTESVPTVSEKKPVALKIKKSVKYEPLEEAIPTVSEKKPIALKIKKREEDKKATKAVLSSPDLMGLIQSYLPKHTEAQIKKFQKEFAESIQYWSDVLFIYDQDVNYSSSKLKTKVQKELKTLRKLLNVVLTIVRMRIEYLAKQSGVTLNDDLFYYGDTDYSDYYRAGVDDNFEVKKDAVDDLENIQEYVIKNYYTLLKELGVNMKEAYEVFNNSKVAKENGIKIPSPEVAFPEPESEAVSPSPAAPEASEFTKKMNELEAVLNEGSTPEILRRAKPLVIQTKKFYDDAGEDATPETNRAESLLNIYNKGVRANKKTGSGRMNRVLFKRKGKKIGGSKSVIPLESELTKKMNEVEAILNEGSTREILRRAKPLIMQIKKLYEESSGILNDETERALKLAKKYNKGIIANRKTGSGRMNRIIFKRKGKKIGGSNDDDDIDDELSSIFENKATISEPAPIRPSVMNVPIVRPTIIRRPAPLPQFVSVIPPRVVEEPKRKAESPKEEVVKRGRGRPRKNGGNVVTDFAKKIFSNSSIPPALKRILDKYGNEKITGMSVGRTPVPSYITGALNVISLGEWKKKFASKPFDKLYHLYMIIQTPKGQFIIEKNERINASENVPASNETMSISGIPDGLTPNILIERTEKYMGGKFLPYSAYDNNCQDFIIAVLKSNHLGNESVYKFVKQDTEDLFKASGTHTRKFANTLTDLGAAASKVFSGGYETDSSSDMEGGGFFETRLRQEADSAVGLTPEEKDELYEIAIDIAQRDRGQPVQKIMSVQKIMEEAKSVLINRFADRAGKSNTDLEARLKEAQARMNARLDSRKRKYDFDPTMSSDSDEEVGKGRIGGVEGAIDPMPLYLLAGAILTVCSALGLSGVRRAFRERFQQIANFDGDIENNMPQPNPFRGLNNRITPAVVEIIDNTLANAYYQGASTSDVENAVTRADATVRRDPSFFEKATEELPFAYQVLPDAEAIPEADAHIVDERTRRSRSGRIPAENSIQRARRGRVTGLYGRGKFGGKSKRNDILESSRESRVHREEIDETMDLDTLHRRRTAIERQITMLERFLRQGVDPEDEDEITSNLIDLQQNLGEINQNIARLEQQNIQLVARGRGEFGGRLNKENIVPPMRKPMPIREMDDEVIARMKARLIRELGEVKLDLETALRMIELGDVSSEERFRTLQKRHGDIEEKLEEIDEEQERRSAIEMATLNTVGRGRDDLKRELKNYNDILGHLSSHLLEKGKQDPKDSRDALKYAKELVSVLQKLKN
jgi:hypothetical protein